MKTIPYKTIRKFCLTVKCAHRGLMTPWWEDGFLYASDGTIMIRIPQAKPLGKQARKDHPRGWEFMEWIPGRRKLRPLTTTPSPHAGHARVGRSTFTLDMIDRIKLLGPVQVCLYAKHAPMYFRFDGGEGLAMPTSAE